MEFKLKAEFVELDNVLKVQALAGNAAEAKELIKAGLVRINGEVETRVRRKLRSGDIVEFKETHINIAGGLH